MDKIRALTGAVRSGADYGVVVERFRAALPYIAHVQAFGHPNGFLAFPLDGFGDEEVRLHTWTGAGARQEDHSIHDHTYDLRSMVLIGTIKQTIWSVRESRDGDLAEFEVSYGEIGSTICATGRSVDVCEASAYEFHPGDRYELPSGQFHSVDALVTPATTIFTKIPTCQGQTSKVIGTRLVESELQALRSPVAPEVSRSALMALIAHLAT